MFPHVSTNLTLQRSAPSFVAGAVMANCQMSHRFLYKRCAKLEGEKKTAGSWHHLSSSGAVFS
jgi:hypothetical protein